MQIGLLTREYPPAIYGGAGVHVEYLSRELSRLASVTVHCFGDPRPGPAGVDVVAHRPWDALGSGDPHAAALQTMSVDLSMAGATGDVDVVHSHTWYANLAGHLAGLLHDVPHVATTHSLEPHRPWKAEQLGGGYALSSFCERTGLESADAVIAVSEGMREDVLAAYPSIGAERVHVISNGIDAAEYRPDSGTDVLARYGIDPDRPSVVFVGRITRQKGVAHLLAAARTMSPDAQLVLCAGAPDTPDIGAEVAAGVAELRTVRSGVVWIASMLPRSEIVQILSAATVFVCPSVYEPLGIVNLEAMACEAAVVATATGGIPEVVVDGETGLLVPFDPVDDASRAPRDPGRFAADIAERVNLLLADPSLARRYGQAGRRRVIEHFGWPVVARRTLELYESLLRG